jgi:hypothetical protein
MVVSLASNFCDATALWGSPEVWDWDCCGETLDSGGGNLFHTVAFCQEMWGAGVLTLILRKFQSVIISR